MLSGKELWELADDFDLTDDDVSILVFADYLEERGEERLANCVRKLHGQLSYRPIWEKWILLLYNASSNYMSLLCDNWIDNARIEVPNDLQLNYNKFPKSKQI